jgi:leucyl/phenylalanyl-tRNA--protein transferase
MFPHPITGYKSPEGLIAIGGELSSARLLSAYRLGIFPWYSEDPILWWNPPQRFILYPQKLHISKNLNKSLRNHNYQIWINKDTAATIRACAETKRYKQDGTWITKDMQSAYIQLHKEGYVYSFETWQDNQLVGGGYGVLIGSMFFGESMFSLSNDASKIAFVYWVRYLMSCGVQCIDCQIPTPYLAQFGAEEITDKDFFTILNKFINQTLQFNISSLDAYQLH